MEGQLLSITSWLHHVIIIMGIPTNHRNDYAQVLGYDKGNVRVINMFINTLIMKGMFSTNHIHARF